MTEEIYAAVAIFVSGATILIWAAILRSGFLLF